MAEWSGRDYTHWLLWCNNISAKNAKLQMSTTVIATPIFPGRTSKCSIIFLSKRVTVNEFDGTIWHITLPWKCYVIVGHFNAHAPFGENGCTSVTCNRLVENSVVSSLCLLNDGRLTRIPDVSTHKATAIDLSLVTSNLAVNCTWYTEEDCLGSDHLPIIIDLNKNVKDDESDNENKIPKFWFKHAIWEAF